jgi:hypothetical protein
MATFADSDRLATFGTIPQPPRSYVNMSVEELLATPRRDGVECLYDSVLVFNNNVTHEGSGYTQMCVIGMVKDADAGGAVPRHLFTTCADDISWEFCTETPASTMRTECCDSGALHFHQIGMYGGGGRQLFAGDGRLSTLKLIVA